MKKNRTGKNFLLLFLFFAASYMLIVPQLMNIAHSSLDNFYNELSKTAAAPLPAPKIAYLTFDDGPSTLTSSVLEILDKNDIKATFFVNYHDYSKYNETLQKIAAAGHNIGNHSYSHVYNKIYSSADAYLTDFDKLQEVIYRATGIKSDIFRYPGGSFACKKYSRTVGNGSDIFKAMSERGYQYYDWNADGGDQISPFPDGKTVANRILKSTAKLSRAVVLLHDTANSQNTLSALPLVIEGLKRQGFTFARLDSDAPPTIFNLN